MQPSSLSRLLGMPAQSHVRSYSTGDIFRPHLCPWLMRYGPIINLTWSALFLNLLVSAHADDSDFCAGRIDDLKKRMHDRMSSWNGKIDGLNEEMRDKMEADQVRTQQRLDRIALLLLRQAEESHQHVKIRTSPIISRGCDVPRAFPGY